MNRIIVGAGVAGLTLANEIVARNSPVILIEKEDRVGGLAKSFRYNDYVFDIGPHRFHTDDPVVQNYIDKILGEDQIMISRCSKVYFRKRYHSWPLNPSSLVKFPIRIMVKAGIDLIFKQQIHSSACNTFEEHIKANYGPTLYSEFFEKYTQKFTLHHPRELHADWAKAGIERAVIDRRVNASSLMRLADNMLLPQTVKSLFIYPPQGIDTFCEKLKSRFEKNNGRLMLQTEVAALRISEQRVKTIRINNCELPVEQLFWSAPLPVLFKLLGVPIPRLGYLSTICYNVCLDSKPHREFQWCYIDDPAVPFVRVSQPHMFSPFCVPSGKSALCVEVVCRENDQIWKDPFCLTDDVLKGLKGLKLIDRSAVNDVQIERVRNSYPIYTADYRTQLDKALQQISSIKNLIPFGRCGSFWYNNMDNSIRTALDLASLQYEQVVANQKR